MHATGREYIIEFHQHEEKYTKFIFYGEPKKQVGK
jgi:hypothetical protein